MGENTLPKAVRDIAWKAQVRLCARYRRLSAAGKKLPVVTAAIAREMAAFLWAIGREAGIDATPPNRLYPPVPASADGARPSHSRLLSLGSCMSAAVTVLYPTRTRLPSSILTCRALASRVRLIASPPYDIYCRLPQAVT